MSERVRVKICGITNREDALSSIDAGADALGFNLWPGSKRCMDLEKNAEWMTALPPFVTRVAVLVNATMDAARRVAAHPAIDMVQFHGDESVEYLDEFARFGRPFIVALRLPAQYAPSRHVLLDASVPGSYGGTGHTVDFSLARAFVAAHPDSHVILAGGLRPDNVGGAVESVKPFAVDVASGVESQPGRKDPEKIRAFVAAVRG